MKFSSTVLITSLLAVARASPIDNDAAAPLDKRATTLDAALLSNIKYYAEYSAAAYCSNNDDSTGDAIFCSTGGCPSVSATTNLEFDDALLTDIRGFVSTSTSKSEIVVSFRGSDSIRNFITDLTIGLVTPSYSCSGCKIHQGFLTAWLEVKSDVVAAVTAAKTAHPTYSLIVTGHSLGGAVAAVAGAELRVLGYAADIYTYGQPRTGNNAWATFVSNQSGITARVTHVNDPVPRLPPLILTSFRHTSPEFWLSNGSATKTDYALADIKTCTGTSNTDCNAGTIPTISVTPHQYYFEYISQCAPALSFKGKRQDATIAGDGASDADILAWLGADATA